MSEHFKEQPKGFATKAIHNGQDPDQWSSKAITPLISLSSTFKQVSPGERTVGAYEYSRSGNPTRTVLEKCLATLDDAKYALTFSSGLGATSSLLSILSAGDHIIVGDDVYGGSYRLVKKVATRCGLKASFVNMKDLIALKNAILPETKLVLFESPSNPLTKVVDIAAICKLCHEHDIIVAVDNTFLTSYFQRPLELGADIALYSLTKYMNGHSDVVMGSLSLNSVELYERLKFIQNAVGAVPSPFDCYLVNRGLKTLELRMQKHQANSIAVAKFLEGHDFVVKVLHPALPSHPDHQVALKQSYGYSGIFSFYMKGTLTQAKKFLKALKIFALAESLGGFESLASLPALMTHASISPEDRQKLGITDSLIRLSVGLEDVDDLIKDLNCALDAAQNHSHYADSTELLPSNTMRSVLGFEDITKLDLTESIEKLSNGLKDVEKIMNIMKLAFPNGV